MFRVVKSSKLIKVHGRKETRGNHVTSCILRDLFGLDFASRSRQRAARILVKPLYNTCNGVVACPKPS